MYVTKLIPMWLFPSHSALTAQRTATHGARLRSFVTRPRPDGCRRIGQSPSDSTRFLTYIERYAHFGHGGLFLCYVIAIFKT